ncbi:hypothetical protein HFO53_20785 [Rhizobium laguerreae]|nr:hypothetical protein [Rhizobium laguerreae]
MELLDEFHLLVHPLLLGKGTRLFDGMDDRVNLRRLDVESFDSGIVKTVYQRARMAATQPEPAIEVVDPSEGESTARKVRRASGFAARRDCGNGRQSVLKTSLPSKKD